MSINTTLAGLSQTPASNGPDGSTDAPAMIDDAIRYALAFIAQLRDGVGLTTGVGAVGQCLISKSGANLLLSPYNGNGLTIGGEVYTIPAAGVTLAPTGLLVGTNYYIYAFMNAGTMTLEASTTTNTISTTTGMRIKSGDSSRTLVGQARIITGPAWSDTPAQRFVLSWFNRRPVRLHIPLTANYSTSSQSLVEITSTFRLETLSWANEAILLGIAGSLQCDSLSTVTTALFTSGAAGTATTNASTRSTIPVGSHLAPACASTVITAAQDGYTYIGMNGSTGAGWATWHGSSGTPGQGSSMFGVIQG